MLEANSMACCRFLQLVRDFVVRVKPYQAAIRYQVKPDEHNDLTLISQRVYGRRDEFLVVMASAGLADVEQPIREQLLVLPTEYQLAALKARAGYENNHFRRKLRRK